MTNQEIIDLFHSDLTLDEVRKVTRCRHHTITNLWIKEFGEDAFKERKRIRYRLSKLADNNPMKGKVKVNHPRWIQDERISDSRGYVRVRVPEWYTGPHDSNGYVREHILSYCQSRGWTEIPRGFHIHHLNMNKQDNDPRNLIMLNNADHLLLHAWIDRALVQRLSKLLE